MVTADDQVLAARHGLALEHCAPSAEGTWYVLARRDRTPPGTRVMVTFRLPQDGVLEVGYIVNTSGEPGWGTRLVQCLADLYPGRRWVAAKVTECGALFWAKVERRLGIRLETPTTVA